MSSQLRPAITLFLLLTILTGVIYPAVVTAIAHSVFPERARGRIIVGNDGIARGSILVGQPFDAPGYFWGRLSATSPIAYNAASSSGSNLGPMNPALVVAAQARLLALRPDSSDHRGKVPVDLVTASGSGLDPHISPAAADYQVARVAKARGLPEEQVRELVHRHTLPRTLGLLGEARVNVLPLNLALDEVPRK